MTQGQDAYDAEFGPPHRGPGRWSTRTGTWPSSDDTGAALALLRPLYERRPAPPTASSPSRSRPGTRPRHRGHHRRRPQPSTRGSTSPTCLVKIPATAAECVPCHPPDDHRGPQHQRHPHLQPGPAMARSSRRTCRASRQLGRSRAGTTCPRWPQRGLVLRQPGRHRGRPAPGGGSLGGGRPRRPPRAAGPGRRGPGAAWPTSSSSRPLRRTPLGGAGGQGRPRPAPAVGLHLHQEPRLSRPGSTSTPSSARTRSTPCPTPRVDAFHDHGAVARTVDTGRRPRPNPTSPPSPAAGIDMERRGAPSSKTEGVASFAKSLRRAGPVVDRQGQRADRRFLAMRLPTPNTRRHTP
jgi:hypothetical protein